MSESGQERGVTPRELKFRAMLESRFGMLRPEDQPLVEIDKAIPLERLIVVPELSSRPIQVSSEEEDWNTEQLLEVLVKDRFTVVLGDPGSGKSMLVRWLISRFASSVPNAYHEALGRLVPIPVVLREMDLSELAAEPIGRWKTFFRAIVSQSFMHELVEPAHLDNWLTSGALMVIDGFDEVASVEVRRRIVDALLECEVINVHSPTRYVLTSRIVGYDREPILTSRAEPSSKAGSDSEEPPEDYSVWRVRGERATKGERFEWLIRGNQLNRPQHAIVVDEVTVEVPVEQVACYFMAPLSDAKIGEFVLSWIQMRESEPATAKDWAGTFFSQLLSRPVLRELARNPQTLGLACYVQRIDGSLPDGRAKLFERVVSAFLNRIPELRRQPFPFPREDARRWLSRIAFEMQRRRSNDEEAERKAGQHPQLEGRGVSTTSKEVGEWLKDEGLRLHGTSPDIEAFLKAVGEASGIFLEREPDRFEFLHLSFQEYLAALHVAESAVWAQRESLWSLDTQATPTHTFEELQSFLGQVTWREVFRLLFQSLPEDRAVELLGRFFKSYRQDLERHLWPENMPAAGKILSQVVADKFAPIPEAVRKEAASILFNLEQKHQESLIGIDELSEPLTEFHLLFPYVDNTRMRRWKQINASPHSLQSLEHFDRFESLTTLNLWGTQVQDITPLKRLTALTELHLGRTRVQDVTLLGGLIALTKVFLWGTQVQDITPLKELTALTALYLSGTQLQDVTPLNGLTSLTELYLNDTQVQDVTPLQRLTALKTLDLDGTQVQDLTPLEGLTALTSLDLNETHVRDLTPLRGLTALTNLYLGSTEVKDITALEGLTALTELSLMGMQVQDITPLQGLTALKTLDLDGTQVQDVTPLQGLSSLTNLYLNDTHVRDVTPLRGLTALKTLDLDGTQVPMEQVDELRRCLPTCLIWPVRR